MKLILKLLITGALLAACTSAPAVISDLESDKVFVQTGLGTTEVDADAKANEGCAMHGRQASEPISHQCLDQYCFSKRFLYACIER